MYSGGQRQRHHIELDAVLFDALPQTATIRRPTTSRRVWVEISLLQMWFTPNEDMTVSTSSVSEC